MRALLYYLAAAPRPESRRRLAGLLWASRGEEQARQSMRQMLSDFRRGPAAGLLLAADDNSISIDLSLVTIDRTALIEAPADADASALMDIANLYRGDFATGLEIGEPEFDVWLQTERMRCREAAIALFDRLVRALADLARHEEALRYANRLAAIDPLREETHRLVMAAEAVASGRASAMQRYEAFRVVLRDELGVHPEAATLRLLDDLRRPEAGQAAPSSAALEPAKETTNPMPVAPALLPARRARRWTRPVMAAGLAVLLLLGGAGATWLSLRADAPIAYIDDNTGRASIAILPFESEAGDDRVKAPVRAFEVEARLAFARQYRMTVIDLPDPSVARDASATGRALRARYVIKTRLSETSDGTRADVSVLDSATGISLATTPMPMSDPPFKFAREMFRYVYPEIALHRAKTLSAVEPDSIPALSWRGAAAQIRTRVGTVDPEEFPLFDKVLARDPDNFETIMALIGSLTLRISRDQSVDRRADLERAEALLLKAREQKPSFADVIFHEGMVKKLRGRFEQAGPDFERAVQLDRAHWNAAAQAAHVKMFLGRFKEAYDQMEAATPNLLPDIGAPESAFLAGETALVAGHIDRAVAYLDIAVRGNATVARIQAMYAAALWMAGREAEAHAAAGLSQTLAPPFPPELFAKRGGSTVSPRYREACDRLVEALRSAIAAPSPGG